MVMGYNVLNIKIHCCYDLSLSVRNRIKLIELKIYKCTQASQTAHKYFDSNYYTILSINRKWYGIRTKCSDYLYYIHFVNFSSCSRILLRRERARSLARAHFEWTEWNYLIQIHHHCQRQQWHIHIESERVSQQNGIESKWMNGGAGDIY